MGKHYDSLVAKHGTYEEFEAACRKALGEISLDEYNAAIRKYAEELSDARRQDSGKSCPPITLTIFEDPEVWLRQHMNSLSTDIVAGVHRISRFDPDGVTTYEDLEEESRKDCTLEDHTRALALLCAQIGRTLFVGGIKSPFELLDPGNWDVEVVDAYYQLVYRGEVIYG